MSNPGKYLLINCELIKFIILSLSGSKKKIEFKILFKFLCNSQKSYIDSLQMVHWVKNVSNNLCCCENICASSLSYWTLRHRFQQTHTTGYKIRILTRKYFFNCLIFFLYIYIRALYHSSYSVVFFSYKKHYIVFGFI